MYALAHPGPSSPAQVYDSAGPLPLDEESDLDMYAAHGPWREWYEVTFLWMLRLRLFQGRQKYKDVPHGQKYWIENAQQDLSFFIWLLGGSQGQVRTH